MDYIPLQYSGRSRGEIKGLCLSKPHLTKDLRELSSLLKIIISGGKINQEKESRFRKNEVPSYIKDTQVWVRVKVKD